jgi:hypothetical protein
VLGARGTVAWEGKILEAGWGNRRKLGGFSKIMFETWRGRRLETRRRENGRSKGSR